MLCTKCIIFSHMISCLHFLYLFCYRKVKLLTIFGSLKMTTCHMYKYSYRCETLITLILIVMVLDF
jgi:hypothetical protein